jgi:hypothetical protein
VRRASIRTAATLDRLTADGTISPIDRERPGADETFGSLERLLRSAELSGHNPDTVLTTAIAAGTALDDARSPAQVLHHRISTALQGQLTPLAIELGTRVGSIRFLLRDRDGKYSPAFDAIFQSDEFNILQTAPKRQRMVSTLRLGRPARTRHGMSRRTSTAPEGQKP